MEPLVFIWLLLSSTVYAITVVQPGSLNKFEEDWQYVHNDPGGENWYFAQYSVTSPPPELSSTSQVSSSNSDKVWGWWSRWNSGGSQDPARQIARNFECASYGTAVIELDVYFCIDTAKSVSGQTTIYYRRGAKNVDSQCSGSSGQCSGWTRNDGSNPPGVQCDTQINKKHISDGPFDVRGVGDTFSVQISWEANGQSDGQSYHTAAFNNFQLTCTRVPTPGPTLSPTVTTATPSSTPTNNPSKSPSSDPSRSPTRRPTSSPTTHFPTKSPTDPTMDPAIIPTINPTNAPTQITQTPTDIPTNIPTNIPTHDPTDPTLQPTYNPSTIPTAHPTYNPSKTDFVFCSNNNDDSIHAGFVSVNDIDGLELICEFCICTTPGGRGPNCDVIDFNQVKQFKPDLIDAFMYECGFKQDCEFEEVGLKKASERLTECGCNVFQCNPSVNKTNTYTFRAYLVVVITIILSM